MALVSTLTGAPSTLGSPANFSSYVSMKEEGTGLYTITIQPTSHISKSLHVQNVSISSQTEMYPSLSTVEPDFYASTARISSVPVSSAQCSSVHSPDTSGKPVTGAGDTGREEGGGDTGEEGADEEVAGKRNIGSLTPCEYTRTSLSTVTKLILAWPGLLYTRPVLSLSRAVTSLYTLTM